MTTTVTVRTRAEIEREIAAMTIRADAERQLRAAGADDLASQLRGAEVKLADLQRELEDCENRHADEAARAADHAAGAKLREQADLLIKTRATIAQLVAQQQDAIDDLARIDAHPTIVRWKSTKNRNVGWFAFHARIEAGLVMWKTVKDFSVIMERLFTDEEMENVIRWAHLRIAIQDAENRQRFYRSQVKQIIANNPALADIDAG